MAILLHTWFYLLVSFAAGNAKDIGIANKPHPFFVSVTTVEHNAAEKILEVSCKFFTDDFEKVLETNNKTVLDITTEKDKPLFEKFIPAYINRHLQMMVDGKPVQLKYIGFEIDKESAYCYFEVNNVTAAKSINITNDLLFDFTKEQINIMHVSVGGQRRSNKLNYPDTKAGFTF